jgi:hypothetical protein
MALRDVTALAFLLSCCSGWQIRPQFRRWIVPSWQLRGRPLRGSAFEEIEGELVEPEKYTEVDEFLDEWAEEYGEDDPDDPTHDPVGHQKMFFPFEFMESEFDPTDVEPLSDEEITFPRNISCMENSTEVETDWPTVSLEALLQEHRSSQGCSRESDEQFEGEALWKMLEERYPDDTFPVINITSSEPGFNFSSDLPDETVVTREELQRVWESKSSRRRPGHEFNATEALLLMYAAADKSLTGTSVGELSAHRAKRASLLLEPQSDVLVVTEEVSAEI